MKKKALSLLLGLSVLVSAMIPGSTVFAWGASEPEPVPAAEEQAEGLETKAMVVPNGDGSFGVRLDAYVTADHKPLDVVLVLDRSEAMKESFGNSTRIQAMIDAAKGFVTELSESYSAGYNHRVGIITYTEEVGDRTKGLVSVDPSGTAKLLSTLDGLSPDSGGLFESASRQIGMAMEQAGYMLESAYGGEAYDTNRQQVVILLTSGKPKDGSYDFSKSVGDEAIAASLEMKKKGALVYSLGIFEEADPSELWGADAYGGGLTHQSNGLEGSHWCGGRKDSHGEWARDIPANNRFLNYLSGNSPDASSLGLDPRYCARGVANGWWIDTNYTCDPALGFYQAATNPEALQTIFASILDNTLKSHVDLDAGTVLREEISSCFDIVPDSVKGYLVPSTGNRMFDEGQKTEISLSINTRDNCLSVSGFDYTHNCVTVTPKGDSTYGGKLMVEFNIIPKDSLIGGNAVPVNEASSGIYKADQTLVQVLPDHTADVAIRYSFQTSDQEIFLGETADLTSRVHTPDNVDGTGNAFVHIIYTLKSGGETVGTYSIPAGSSTGVWEWKPGHTGAPILTETTEYEAECVVSPSVQGIVPDTEISSQKFTVVVESGTLSLRRIHGEDDETYVLRLMKNGKEFMTVAVENGKPVTIVGIPAGKYTVEEDTNWSWRYQYSSREPVEMTIDREHTSGSFVVEAERTNGRWLNDYDKKVYRGGAQ